MENKTLSTILFYMGWKLRIACLIFITANFIIQLCKWDIHEWFKTGVTIGQNVTQWNDSYLDEHLHELSRWDGFNATQWQKFVQHSYIPLLNKERDNNISFRFLEIGVGVGAWARVFLNAFPHATGYGIDLEATAVNVANSVLSTQRYTSSVLNMILVPQVYTNRNFDYIFIPGTLCYADNLWQVQGLISGLYKERVIKKKGRISITMLASTSSPTGSCVTRIPKTFWYSMPFMQVLDIQEMDSWGLPHGLGRYAVFLECKE